MQYRVLKFFIDRETVSEHNAGDLFPCDDPKRASELIYKGYIEKVQEDAPAIEQPLEKPKPTKTAKAKAPAKKAATKKKA